MTAWTDPTARSAETPPPPPGVILHPDRLAAVSPPQALAPGEALAVLLERHWILTWDLPAPQTFPSSLVPHLSHNLSREVGAGRPGVPDDGVVVTGVSTRRFDVDVRGQGFVLGTKFHPGAFAAITDVPAASLTDRTVRAEELLPREVVEAYAAPRDAGDPEGFRHTVEAALAPLLDRVDDDWTIARDLVAAIAEDEGLTTVAAASERSGLTERSLQRLFRRFVGVSPKQAITRHRLHDVVHALDQGSDEPLADIAARLGFFDQAHLAREFTRFVGIAPSAYRAGRPVRA